ncbi:E3 ubiquitin-protein ligase [Blattella germanica]|nr:E3 ubiquitin-protein ligase [Blattella germanica]
MFSLKNDMETLVHGVGDEVIMAMSLILIIVIPLIVIGFQRTNWRDVTVIFNPPYGARVENVEPGENSTSMHTNIVKECVLSVNWIRNKLFSMQIDLISTGINTTNLPPPVHTYNSERCPICLNSHQLAVETNCGHLYCGNCLRTYILGVGILTPISCPMCRQSVTMLFVCFTAQEIQTSPSSTVNLLYTMVENYNSRYSGTPRSIVETIRDMPTLLRHLWNEFFSVGGLVAMFRVRICLCLVAAILYLFLPLDIIPEAVFGIVGFLDDIFVLFVLVIYISIIYRRLVSNRRLAL